jgi:hypothetical protein
MPSIRTVVVSLAAAFGAASTFAVSAASPPIPPATAVEFYHAAFDHYFITSLPNEIDDLDSGRTVGWTRTGRGFAVEVEGSGGGANPVCRFYIPPQHGDSHFFSASPAECAAILAKIGTDPNYSGYLLESPNAFYAPLPNTTTGSCRVGTVPVYRLWNQRVDSNHRYTTDTGIKAAMVAKGYVAEGYGPVTTSLCTTTALLLDALTRASALSPYAPGCDGVPATGTVYINAEVEPFIAVNPANPDNFIGVWQQDRWSNGGARGLGAAYTLDGGGTWTRTSAAFSRCSGGSAVNGADFERNSDPWVSFSPDGTAHQSALAFNNVTNGNNAILVSRSSDGGRTWSSPITVRSDGAQNFNDKEAITADPTDSRYVYVVWDRLTGNNGPTWLARTTDGGATWEPARNIYDPGANSQTLNNQIVVLPNGTLINFFTELVNVGPQDARLRIIRSADRGVTWSPPITISDLQSAGTFDTETGIGIRDGSAIGAIAAGQDGTLAVVWQDSRFPGGAHDKVAFSRSVDGGLTWTPPLRINGDVSVPALIPSVTIRTDGMIGVNYYDLRSNTADPATLPTDTWLATSSDGVTWTERRLGAPFDYTKAPLAGGRYFIGDYVGMAHVGTTFLPFFPKTTAAADNRTDVLLALSRVTTPTGAAVQAVATGTAPAGAPTAAMAVRIRDAIRTAVRARLPDAVARRMSDTAPATGH